MSEVIIKQKRHNNSNGKWNNKFYDILYKDDFIDIEGFAFMNCKKENHHYFAEVGWEILTGSFKTAEEAINKAIEKLKKLVKDSPEYIPTLMRLTALKETL